MYLERSCENLIMATTPSSQFLKRRALRNGRENTQEDAHRQVQQGQGTLETEYVSPSNVPPHNDLELLAVFYHFAMTLFYALLLYYGNKLMSDNLHVLDPKGIMPSYGGRFKFLTHINQWFQLCFFGVQFLTDLLANSIAKRILQKVCDVFFTTVAAPTSFFVAVTFWSIYAYDRSLVYPERFDLFVPAYMNHFWHTTIAAWVLFETIICFHHYPSTGTAACINFAVNAGYLSWIVWIFVKTGFWVYPILKVLPLPFLTLFCGGSMFFSLVLYLVGKLVADLRWGKTVYIE